MQRFLDRRAGAALAALVALTVSCVPVPEPKDPQDVVTRPATCAGYCDHLRAMACAGGADTEGGAPCEAVCENAIEAGVRWDLQCRATAPSCSAVEACERR
jgi:hypothetical protein